MSYELPFGFSVPHGGDPPRPRCLTNYQLPITNYQLPNGEFGLEHSKYHH